MVESAGRRCSVGLSVYRDRLDGAERQALKHVSAAIFRTSQAPAAHHQPPLDHDLGRPVTPDAIANRKIM